jgi:hypothetical protein
LEFGFGFDAVLVDQQDPLRASTLKPDGGRFNGTAGDKVISLSMFVGVFVVCR